MRTAIRTTMLGLAIMAIVGFPASAAPGPRTPPGLRVDVHAAAGRAVQGGTLRVLAWVRLPRFAQGMKPTADAVVHFASGDVSVPLTEVGGRLRSWGSGHAWWAPARVWRAAARVPVAVDEQVGRVPVDVTVALGDGSVTVATVGWIRPARHGHTPPPPTTDPDPPCTEGCQEV